MMRGILVIACLLAHIVYGQGLNGELGFNEDYSQNAKAIIAYEDHSIFVKEQTLSASFFTRSSLVKVDTLGNEIWEVQIAPQFAEVVLISEIIPSETDGMYILGFARPTCDVAGGCFWFLEKRDSNGFLEWERIWNDQVCFGVEMSGLSLSQNNELLIHYNDFQQSNIYTLTTTGSDIDTIATTQAGYAGTAYLSGFGAVGYKQFSLFGFDNLGNVITENTFSTFISDAVAWNDTLYVTTQDSIFSFKNSMQLIHGEAIAGFSDYKQLKVRNSDVRLLSSGNSNISILELDRDLLLVNTKTINFATEDLTPIDYHDDHISVAQDFDLSEYVAIRHLDYSLNSNIDTTVNRSDVGIADIQITQATVTPNPTFNSVFSVEIAADVLLKNYGPNTVESCRMNHYVSPALACGLIYYGEEFFNLNLTAGDSMWVSLGVIHSNERTFPNDSLNQEICIYTSFANGLTDLEVSNDRMCTTVTLGTAQLNELMPSKKKLVRIVDILGREIENGTNQWVVYIYDDGSTDKVFQLTD